MLRVPHLRVSPEIDCSQAVLRVLCLEGTSIALVQLLGSISALQIAGTTCSLDQALNLGCINPRVFQVK